MSTLKAGDNLFDKIGKKTEAEGAADDKSAEPSPSTDSAGKTDGGKAKSDDKAAAKSQTGAEVDSAESKSASGKEEPSGSEGGLLDDLTPESAYKEIKKLREENKAYRIKYAEKLDKLKEERDSELQAERERMKELQEAAKELEKIKALEADKKRSQEEKLADREKRIAELESRMEQSQVDYEKQLQEAKNAIATFEADREAEMQVYQNRLNDELAKIPEEYREYAELIVKGAGDPREAIVALNEAKIKGIFDEKQVVVNHSVPSASTGARATKEQLDNAARGERGKMSSQQKIKAALAEIKGGQENSAFRTRK